MENRIDALSNAVRAIGAKLDKLSQKIDSHDEKIDAIGTGLDRVDKRLDRPDQKVDRLDQKADRFDAKIDAVGTQLTSAIRSVSERIDRHWESLTRNGYRRSIHGELYSENPIHRPVIITPHHNAIDSIPASRAGKGGFASASQEPTVRKVTNSK